MIDALIDQACSDNAALLKSAVAYIGGTVAVASIISNARNSIAKLPGGPAAVKFLDVAAFNFVKRAAQEAAQKGSAS